MQIADFARSHQADVTQVLAKCAELGIDVRTPDGTLTEHDTARLRAFFSAPPPRPTRRVEPPEATRGDSPSPSAAADGNRHGPGTRRAEVPRAAVAGSHPAGGAAGDARPASAGTRRAAEPSFEEDGLAGATRPAQPRIRSVGFLEPGAILPLQIPDTEYRVVRTIQDHESRKPGIFECEVSGRRVIVKIAATDFPPRTAQWNRLTALVHPHVVHTFEVGNAGGHFYEVQELYPGGSLHGAVRKPEWVIRVFVPQMSAALAYLHDQDLVHRDVKPSNIFARNPEGTDLVLGDLDTSSQLDRTQSHRATSRAEATWLYTAPEGFPRFTDDGNPLPRQRVTRAMDYYSLGVTIIELLAGTTAHDRPFDDVYDFYLSGNRIEIPANMPGALKVLLAGLLIRNYRTRWQAEEVTRWLAGRTTAKDRERSDLDRSYALGGGSHRPYQSGVLRATDLRELASALHANPSVGKDHLLQQDSLLVWIGEQNADVALAIRRVRETYRRRPDVVLFGAILACDPDFPMDLVDGIRATTVEEWAERVDTALVSGNRGFLELAAPDRITCLELWLRLGRRPNVALADAIAKVPREGPPALILQEVVWLCAPHRELRFTRDVAVSMPSQIPTIAYGRAEEWVTGEPVIYQAVRRRWEDGTLEAFVRCRAPHDSAALAAIRTSLAGQVGPAFEHALRVLDPKLPNVEIEMDTGFSGVIRVQRGERRAVKVGWKAVTCGVPFGAFFLAEPTDGVEIDAPLVHERRGSLELGIDAENGALAAGRTFSRDLTFEGPYTAVRGLPRKVRYRIGFPVQRTVFRALSGMVMGALLFGSSRAVIGALGLMDPVSAHRLDVADIFGRTWDGHGDNLPYPESIGAFIVVALTLFVAWRACLFAIRRAES